MEKLDYIHSNVLRIGRRHGPAPPTTSCVPKELKNDPGFSPGGIGLRGWSIFSGEGGNGEVGEPVTRVLALAPGRTSS
jgi:hypothetical protein